MADVGFRMLKQDDMSDKTVYSRRNPAIDMLRALTMFTMIFVNEDVYKRQQHTFARTFHWL